jgi:glycine/D-amino acid oxidase-like deaminating enzyme
MRVLVIGAGIIGSIYSWALAESGHHILHLVPGKASALSGGLALDVLDNAQDTSGTSGDSTGLNALETSNFRIACDPPTESSCCSLANT